MKNYDIWGVQPQSKSIQRNLEVVQQQQDTIIVNETDYRNGRGKCQYFKFIRDRRFDCLG